MGKMVDKDELRVLRRLAESKASDLNPGEGILYNEILDTPKRAMQETDSKIAKRVVGSMEMPESMKLQALKNISKKGLGRAASIAAGPLGMLLSEVADASEIAPSDTPATKEEMDKALLQMQKESALEQMRNRANNRAESAMAKQNRLRDIQEKMLIDEKINTLGEQKSDEELEEEASKLLHKRKLMGLDLN